jgi:CRP-like cAMP-binding protein
MPDSKILRLLSENEKQRLAPFLKEVQLRQNQELLEAGAPFDHVWFPQDCVTSTVVDSAEGATIEVGLMGYDGMVGLSLLFGKAVSNSTVIVQIPGRAVRMSANDFRQHVVEEGGELFKGLLNYADTFMAMVAQTAACNSLHSIDERLSRWILMVRDRVDKNEMPLTQEFLAYMLGVRRPSVSLAASGLQQLGLIQYSRGHVTVLNREGLEDRTCPCYQIIRNIANDDYALDTMRRREGA